MEMNGRGFHGDYRFGYQGSEKDNEVSGDGNSYTTEFRQLDPRLGRWFSVDPVFQPWQSPYTSMDNDPVNLTDGSGRGTGKVIKTTTFTIDNVNYKVDYYDDGTLKVYMEKYTYDSSSGRKAYWEEIAEGKGPAKKTPTEKKKQAESASLTDIFNKLFKIIDRLAERTKGTPDKEEVGAVHIWGSGKHRLGDLVKKTILNDIDMAEVKEQFEFLDKFVESKKDFKDLTGKEKTAIEKMQKLLKLSKEDIVKNWGKETDPAKLAKQIETLKKHLQEIKEVYNEGFKPVTTVQTADAIDLKVNQTARDNQNTAGLTEVQKKALTDNKVFIDSDGAYTITKDTKGGITYLFVTTIKSKEYNHQDYIGPGDPAYNTLIQFAK